MLIQVKPPTDPAAAMRAAVALAGATTASPRTATAPPASDAARARRTLLPVTAAA